MNRSRSSLLGRTLATVGGVAGGTVSFLILQRAPLFGAVLIGTVFLVGVVTFVTITVSRERAFNRRAAAVFYPSMTGQAPAPEADEVAR